MAGYENIIYWIGKVIGIVPNTFEKLTSSYWPFLVILLSLLVALWYSKVPATRFYSSFRKGGIIFTITLLLSLIFLLSKS